MQSLVIFSFCSKLPTTFRKAGLKISDLFFLPSVVKLINIGIKWDYMWNASVLNITCEADRGRHMARMHYQEDQRRPQKIAFY